MLAESVAEPTSSFADVTQGACTTSNDVNEVTSGTCELLSNCQRSTRGADLGRWIGVGADLATWTATGKVPFESSPVFILDWRLLWTKESLKLESRRYAPRTRKLRKISMVSGSDLSNSKFLVRMFLACMDIGRIIGENQGDDFLVGACADRLSYCCLLGDGTDALEGFSGRRLLEDSCGVERKRPFPCFCCWNHSYHCISVWGGEVGCAEWSLYSGPGVKMSMWVRVGFFVVYGRCTVTINWVALQVAGGRKRVGKDLTMFYALQRLRKRISKLFWDPVHNNAFLFAYGYIFYDY